MKKWGCITLDLEEDNGGISKNITYDSLKIFPELLGRLKEMNVPLTIFVAGNFLENQGEYIRSFASEEFHSHGYLEAREQNEQFDESASDASSGVQPHHFPHSRIRHSHRDSYSERRQRQHQ